MSDRKKLSDILLGSDWDRLERSWSTTEPADDLKPIPAGDYRCRVVSGELFTAKSGTPGYKVTLDVIDGRYASRRLWLDLWLSPAALAMTKRDLLKLGIDRPDQLERPLPDGIIVAARVALRRGDDGSEFNRISRFDVVAVEPTEPEPFAPHPADSTDASGFDWSSGEQGEGEPTP